jgi:hypothetical protein
MACSLPEEPMTPVEHSCCVQMHHHCGDMDMPCCHKQVRTELSAVTAKQQHAPLLLPAITHPTAFVPILWPTFYALPVILADVSPPPSPPVSITILRI